MRNKTIDIAKGIGILAVVICHNWILYHDRGEFSRVVFSFHMPLFFFISGVFFKPYLSFKETLLSKANSLLKPYFVVIIFLILFDFVSSTFKARPFSTFHALIKGLYSSTFTLDWVQLWFLSHLFAIYLFAWLLHKLLLKHITNRLTCMLAILIMFSIGVQTIDLFWSKSFNPFGINALLYGDNPHFLGLPFNIDLLLVTTPIFLAGYFFSKEILAFKFNAFLFWPSFVIFTFLHYKFDYTMGLHDRQYDHLIITTCQMVTGVYLVFGLSALIARFSVAGKVLAYLGSASLFILIFHFNIQHMFTGVFQYKFPQYNFSIAVTAFVIAVLYSVIIYEIVNRYQLLKKLFYDTSKRLITNATP
jgi:polysaccharide biosynthesis protein PslL